MRTTLELDDDVLESVRALADERQLSIDAVVSDLLRRSMESSQPPIRRSGFLLFPVREGARPVTPELVGELFEE